MPLKVEICNCMMMSQRNLLEFFINFCEMTKPLRYL